MSGLTLQKFFSSWLPSIAVAAALTYLGVTFATSRYGDYASGITTKEWSSGEVDTLIRKAVRSQKFKANLNQTVDDLTLDQKALIGIYLYFYNDGSKAQGIRSLALLNETCNAGQNRACAYVADSFIRTGGDYARSGFELLDRICSDGTMTGCYMLTNRYARGDGVSKSRGQAIKYAELSCADPSELSCPYAAKAIADFDPGLSRAYFEASCEQDVLKGCYYLALGHSETYGEESPADTLARFEELCRTGYGAACNQVVWYHNQEIAMPKDIEGALKRLRPQCEEEMWDNACAQLAVYYSDYSDYVLHEPEPYLHYTSRGCALGDEMQCDMLVNSYDRKLGSARLQKDALNIMRKLCPMGRRGTCEKVAEIEIASRTYQPSGGQDQKNDVDDRACKLGDGEACRRAGWDYAFGEKGRKQDVQQAALMFMIGCDHGYGPSCVDRGSLYEYALHGMEADLAEATRMYERACKLKHPFACDQYKQAMASLQ